MKAMMAAAAIGSNAQFTCAATLAGKVYRVTLTGLIRQDNKNAASEVIAALDAAPKSAETRVLLRDFYGGDIGEGLSIYHDVKERGLPIDVDGMVASMGFVIMCAGSKVTATKRTKGMMHRAGGQVSGNADELAATAKLLAEMEQELVDVLAERTGLDAAAVRSKFMVGGKDTWFTAEQLLELKLVDEVIPTATRTVAMREVQKMRDPVALFAAFAACYDEPNGLTAEQTTMKKELFAKLALAEGASQDAVDVAVEKVLAENEALKKEKSDREAATLSEAEKEVGALLDAAQKKNQLTAASVVDLKAQAKAAPVATLSVVKAMLGAVGEHKSLTAQLTTADAADKTLAGLYAKRSTEGWDYTRWSKDDHKGLAKLKAEMPEQFKELQETLKS